MQPARASWTDERLGDLSARVDRGFEKVDRDIRELRMEVKSGDEALRREMNAGFLDVNARFADLERTIRWFGGLTILTLAAALLEGRF
jgi:hypothetical protein